MRIGGGEGAYSPSRSAAPTLKNNKCSKNEQDGIYLGEGAGGVAEGNKCNDNKWWGIRYDDASKPGIRNDNTASGNKQGQIWGR
jgi:parallel beta-helix repeat protein